MSVEFRQRTPSEYARMLWRRKWLIALPAAAVALAVGYVVWKLPNVYESTTLLTVRPASISTSIVPQLSDNDLTIRINNIGQEVTSRSSLEPLIERYGLYAAERRRGEPMDVLVERMRTRDVRVEINQTRDDITNGFYLSFRGPDPRVTQAVTEVLASKYINAQTTQATNEAAGTKQFFDEKLRQAKDELDAIDKQRIAYMAQNVGALPSQGSALVERLSGLYEQQKAYMTEIGRLRDQIAAGTNVLGEVRKQHEQEIEDVVNNTPDPKSYASYAELVRQESQHRAQLQDLLTKFKEKHPDVVAKRAELAAVTEKMEKMDAERKQSIADREKRLKNRPNERVYSIQAGIARAEGEMALQQRLLAQTTKQIADLEGRVNQIPGVEVGLGAINREYESKKGVYETLLGQREKADIISSVTQSAQGESIAVIDGANLPERPVAPNRLMLALLGLAAGLGAGLALAAAFEVPRLLTIQTSEDAAHYTGLPVLVTLPNMFTAREQRRIRLRRAAFSLAGVAAAVLSVPALIIVLRLTHIMEVFASRG